MSQDSQPVPVPPPDTGSSATQEAAGRLTPTPVALDGLPMVQAVVGLAATRSRGLGGEIAAGLLAGAFQQTVQDSNEKKQELAAVREKLEQANENLGKAKIKVAVLEVRLAELSAGRHLKNILLTVGCFLIGLGIDFYRSKQNAPAVVFVVIGVALVLVGWLPPSMRVEK